MSTPLLNDIFRSLLCSGVLENGMVSEVKIYTMFSGVL